MVRVFYPGTLNTTPCQERGFKLFNFEGSAVQTVSAVFHILITYSFFFAFQFS